MRIARLLVASVGLATSIATVPEFAPQEGSAASRLAPALALAVTPVVSGLSIPWDVAFADDGTMFFTERAGRISVRLIDGVVRRLTANMNDLWAQGETGLMGIELDPAFNQNRRVYTCQGTLDNNNTVQVLAWVADAGLTRLDRVNDPLVGGIDGSSGRHGGCQLRIGPDGTLLIGTGDAATGTNPQNLQSLAGKTLRVNRFTGAPVPGNAGGGDPRIYTYGHRNVQGLAVRTNGQVFSIEHGSDRDDEVNILQPGGNYGWDPVPGYNETRPMTDFGKFPNAVGAVWSSGFPTIATSAGTFLRGAKWQGWNGALAVSVLAGRHLRVFFLDSRGAVVDQYLPPELNGRFGRLRGAELGPDGDLFVTTSNGSNDAILRVSPVPSSAPGSGHGGDIVALDPATGSSYVARSSGDSFTPFGHVWLTGWGAGNFRLLPGDVNADGRTDLIAKATNGSWYVALSNGNGFVPSDHLWLTNWAWGDGFTLLAGDVTGDGRDDIVALDPATGSSYVARSSGDGFTPFGHVWLTGWGAGNFRLLPGDVNADGRTDLIAKATNGSWYVALSNGNGFVPSDHLWLTNWAWGDGFTLLAGDVTGD
jgi:glucose/arabinose dehydrogenase